MNNKKFIEKKEKSWFDGISKHNCLTIEYKKIPSQFSVRLSPIFYNNSKFINFSKIKKSCGRAENRTRNCWVTTNYFATKLLAHSSNLNIFNYLNFNEKWI